MNPLNTIYILMTGLAIVMALPQLRQLWQMKNSDEFNPLSWSAWLVAQITQMVYAISIHSMPYFIVNIMWIAFYVTMVYLILRFRHPSSERATETASIDDER